MDGDSWTHTTDVGEFARTTIPFLEAQPARNTIQLSVFAQLHTQGPHAFGDRDPQLLTWYDAAGKVAGAAVRTPPHPLVLTDVPLDALGPLIDLMLDQSNDLDAREINLSKSHEEVFAAEWTARTGHAPSVAERDRLYRLKTLTPPEPAPPGSARLATPRDVPLVAQWLTEFWPEVGHMSFSDLAATAESMAANRIAEGLFRLWLDGSGTPVSLAGHTPILAGMARIGPVYTPKELRGRGYAAGATTSATQALLDEGAREVLLFTDLTNPTSNALYQRLGYREVSDRLRFKLEA